MAKDNQKRFDGELLGATIRPIFIALKAAPQLAERLLRSVGIEELKDDAWYDLNTVCALQQAILAEVGRNALTTVGMNMLEATSPPPGVHDVASMMELMDAGYKAYARGRDIGGITCTFPEGREGRSAVLVFNLPTLCVINMGTVRGCCKKFGGRPLIEHGTDGCVDEGGSSCTYRVTW